MVNISKEPLRKAFSDELFRQLAQAFAETTFAKEKLILMALLTDAEQIMLAKRLAAVYMLGHEFPNGLIARSLNMSRTTINGLYRDYEKGRFEALGGKKRRMTEEEKDELWRKVGYILRLGLPPMAGDERKYWLNRHFGKPTPKRHR